MPNQDLQGFVYSTIWYCLMLPLISTFQLFIMILIGDAQDISEWSSSIGIISDQG